MCPYFLPCSFALCLRLLFINPSCFYSDRMCDQDLVPLLVEVLYRRCDIDLPAPLSASPFNPPVNPLLCVSVADLSEKKSDLRVCDDSTCRYGGVCRDDGAQLKCVCQFQVRTEDVCCYLCPNICFCSHCFLLKT